MRHPRWPARRLVLASVAVAIATGLAGCAPGPVVLATVGTRTITADDFLDVARQSQDRYPGPAGTARAALLEDLVQRELLVAEARRRGLLPPEELARLHDQALQQLTLRTLIQRLAPPDAPVSDAEVRALWQMRASEVHTLVVFTPDRAACGQALAEIRGGADFGAVADRFNTTGITPPHGDLGFLTPGTLLPALDAVINGGPVGVVCGPLESPGDGWFLVKLTERRARRQEPFERIREQVRAGLQRGKQRVLLNRFQQGLAAQYHVGIEPGAAQALFAHFNAPRDSIRVGAARMAVPAPLTPEEARRVLLRYDGEDGRTVAYTMGDAAQDLSDPTRIGPVVTVLPLIEQWLRGVAMQRVIAVEIHRRHLDEEPAIARHARGQVENALLQAAYETLVVAATTVTEDDLRAAFRRHAAQLVDPTGAPLDYARLEPNLREALQGEAITLRREERLQQVTDSLRLRIRPVLHRDRLARIPWPVPAESDL